MNRLALALVLFAATASSVHAQQREERGAIVDEDYRFRLHPPAGWRLLPEEEVQKMVPDAVAGAFNVRGSFGVVIPERVDDIEIETYANILYDNMEVENKELVRFDEVEFHGLRAIHYVVHATTSDIDFRYDNIVYIKEGWAFQALTWCARETGGLEKLVEFHDTFEVLPGEIQPRVLSVEIVDSNGPGWRVRDGAFESAATALAVEPQEDWRIAVGAELDFMNADAEVGLVHTGPDVYGVVVTEPAFGVDEEAYAASLLAEDLDLMRRTEEERTYLVGGTERTFQVHRPTGDYPFLFLRSVFFQDRRCVQVLMWHMEGLEESASEVIPAGLASIRFLSEEEVEEATRAIEGLPDTENRVGTNFSLRRGVYRDFQAQLTWSKPSGVWRVVCGDEARLQNPDATLILEEPSLGLYGILIAEYVGPDYEDREYLDAVCAGMFGDDHPDVTSEPREVQLGGAKGMARRVKVDYEGLTLSYVVTTIVRGDMAYQLLLYGVPGNMEVAGGVVGDAIRGLSFPARLDPVTSVARRHSDLRLGFELTLPRGSWQHLDRTPRAARSIGAFDEWRSPSGDTLMTVALCALSDGQDESWFQDFLEDAMKAEIGTAIREKTARTTSTLAGLPCHVMRWQTREGTMEAYSLLRDKTFYGLLVLPSRGSSLTVESLKENYRLLD